jgi:hypothetical protein
MKQELKRTSSLPPTLNKGKQDLGTPETILLDIYKRPCFCPKSKAKGQYIVYYNYIRNR